MLLNFEVRTVIIILTVVLAIFLAYLVTKSSKNFWLRVCFATLVVSFISWSLTTYLSTIEYFAPSVTIISRLALLFAVFMSHALTLVIYYAIYEHFPSPRFVKVWSLASALFVPFTLTSYFFVKSEFVLGGIVTYVGPLIPLFSFYAAAAMLLPVYFLLRAYHYSSGDARKRVIVLLVGFGIMFSGFLGAILMPIVLSHNAGAVPLGPLFVDVFLFAIALVITRYELFKIRALSIEALAILLNFLFLLLMWFARGTDLFSVSLFIFIIAVAVSILFIENSRRVLAIEVDYARMQALEESKAELSELDRAKNDFIALAAHQLRTPLSVVSGYIELLKEGAYGKIQSQAVSVLDNMEENNKRLSNIIDDFLDIAKIEAGMVGYTFTKANISNILKDVVRKLEDCAQAKRLHLVCAPSRSNYFASVDASKIAQVFETLLENAIKYSDRGVITVSVASEDNGIACTVRDEGIGFRPIESTNLFHKFYRGASASLVDANGVGLGLYLAKKIIDAHHGKIWATSPGPNLGSEFNFWVPVEQPLV